MESYFENNGKQNATENTKDLKTFCMESSNNIASKAKELEMLKTKLKNETQLRLDRQRTRARFNSLMNYQNIQKGTVQQKHTEFRSISSKTSKLFEPQTEKAHQCTKLISVVKEKHSEERILVNKYFNKFCYIISQYKTKLENLMNTELQVKNLKNYIITQDNENLIQNNETMLDLKNSCEKLQTALERHFLENENCIKACKDNLLSVNILQSNLDEKLQQQNDFQKKIAIQEIQFSDTKMDLSNYMDDIRYKIYDIDNTSEAQNNAIRNQTNYMTNLSDKVDYFKSCIFEENCTINNLNESLNEIKVSKLNEENEFILKLNSTSHEIDSLKIKNDDQDAMNSHTAIHEDIIPQQLKEIETKKFVIFDLKTKSYKFKENKESYETQKLKCSEHLENLIKERCEFKETNLLNTQHNDEELLKLKSILSEILLETDQYKEQQLVQRNELTQETYCFQKDEKQLSKEDEDCFEKEKFLIEQEISIINNQFKTTSASKLDLDKSLKNLNEENSVLNTKLISDNIYDKAKISNLNEEKHLNALQINLGFSKESYDLNKLLSDPVLENKKNPRKRLYKKDNVDIFSIKKPKKKTNYSKKK